MLNLITVQIYGNDRTEIFDELIEFSQFPSSPIPSYSNTYIQNTIDRFYKIIEFLEKSRRQFQHLNYKIFYEGKRNYEYSISKQPELKTSKYFIFCRPALINFNPCDLAGPSSTYFSADAKKQANTKKEILHTCVDVGYDFDGTLYYHHSIARKITEYSLKGIEFVSLDTSDKDQYSYPARLKSDDLDLLGKETSCAVDSENEMLYLDKKVSQDKKEEFINMLIRMKRKYGESPAEAKNIKEYAPSEGTQFSKWMAADVTFLPGVESKKSTYTTQNRICPITSRKYPLLTSQLYLKEADIPPELDFFRTENNHLIVSKKVFEIFTKENILPMNMYCEPVLLEKKEEKSMFLSLFASLGKAKTADKTIINARIEDTKDEKKECCTDADVGNPEVIKGFLKKYGRVATVLHPCLSKQALSFNVSKMGGIPDLRKFEQYPKCDVCQTNLNFVIQLYKLDFPEFYFPKGKDLFQLFRCPNLQCNNDYSDNYDQKVFPYFFKMTETKKEAQIAKEVIPAGKDFEAEVPECELKPEKKMDYPIYEDCDHEDIRALEIEYGEKKADILREEYACIEKTKINGYPCFDQNSNIPLCECGRDKEMIFQLSSDDRAEGAKGGRGMWSPHGIMIGDVGKIFVFVCKNCGEESIDSRWDCG